MKMQMNYFKNLKQKMIWNVICSHKLLIAKYIFKTHGKSACWTDSSKREFSFE